MDHKDRIVRYMVSNGFKYKWDVNWGEVANLPQFRGTTGVFLEREYDSMVVGAKRKYPDMKNKDISSNLVLDWHKNKKYQGKAKKKIEKENAFIELLTVLNNEE